MQKGGVSVHDPRMTKMLSLAADYFLAKTIHEARQLSLLRTQSGSGGAGAGAGGNSAAASASNAAAKGVKGKKKAAAAAAAAAAATASSHDPTAEGQGQGQVHSISDIFLLEDLQRALADQGIHISSKNQ